MFSESSHHRYDELVEPTPPNPNQPGSGQPGSGPSDPNPLAHDQPYVQPFHHQPVAARVPERVARGIYSTGQIVLDSPKEFVIDFLQGLTRPYQVVARVVVAPQTMLELKNALEQNVATYTRSFGPPPALPIKMPQQRPTLQEIYENFKLPEDVAPGMYANSVLIGHSPAEFFFDFITAFYPTSTVSARIFLPAPMVPRFLSTIQTCLQQFQLKYAGRAATPHPPQQSSGPPASPPNPESPQSPQD